MPTPQRISLIEAYDNRDVVAWLVRHSEEIKDLQAAVDALPDNDEFVLTIGDQTISGTKSFVDKIAAAGGIEADTLVKINADLQVFGDIYQNGSAYDTHAEQLYTTKDYILMRDGAAVGLAPGAMSGLEIIKYDGTNNLRLAADASGVARIGDVGDEQPLLTRAEAADLTDGDPLCWDSTEQKAVPFSIAAGTNIVISQVTHGIEISAVGGGSNEWTEHTGNDWSDIFEIVDSKMRTKCEVCIYSYGETLLLYIPKGVESNTDSITFYIPNLRYISGGDNKLATALSLTIGSSQITGSQINGKYVGYTLTTDGSTVTAVMNSNLQSHSITKSSLKVYVR